MKMNTDWAWGQDPKTYVLLLQASQRLVSEPPTASCELGKTISYAIYRIYKHETSHWSKKSPGLLTKTVTWRWVPRAGSWAGDELCRASPSPFLLPCLTWMIRLRWRAALNDMNFLSQKEKIVKYPRQQIRKKWRTCHKLTTPPPPTMMC